MEAGTVLCAHPGEVYFSRRVLAPGAAIFLAIDSSVFHEHLSKQALHASELQLRAFTKMSKRLEAKFLQVFRVVRPGSTTLEAQTATVDLIEVILAELLEESSDEGSSIDAALRNAERFRERAHGHALATILLSAPAKQDKMSRFRVLRRFKLRYGLPPHTYQLSVRLGLAQKALREGQQPAQVAADYGFFDQSHLTRHFKRFLGVTPAQYARVGARARSSGVTDAIAELAC
jgi:AraC-like DNA-binding protein